MRKIPKKIEILKFVVEQGIVSASDVKSKFNIPDTSDVARKTMSEMKIGHVKYGVIKNGVWFVDRQELLDLLHNYYMDMPTFEVRKMNLHEVPHSLRINHIRLMFEKAVNVEIVDWYSERYLRALDSYRRDGLSLKKLPDAVFFRKGRDGQIKKHFLEYERTLKNKDRYDDIFSTYSKRYDTVKGSVLYICEHPLLKARLVKMLDSINENYKGRGEPLRTEIFRFETLEEFNHALGQKEEDFKNADITP